MSCRYVPATSFPVQRKIIHVDMDAFYASVEQRDDAALRGLPVAVGHGGPRGVVLTASYEARVFGVRSAMPSTVAKRRCPALIFVPTRFDAYKEASAAIRAIFADYADAVEPLSLDEAYLDVTGDKRGLGTASATARAIRARIRDELGLTASAGVSYNKQLAKLASDQNKPDGQCVITPALAADFLAALDVGRFHGVGPRAKEKLNALGIMTGAHLRAQSLDLLEHRFGSAGRWYHDIARGIDERPVHTHRKRKSSGSETTFSTDLTEDADIEAAVVQRARRMWAWCDGARAFGRTVTVKIKWADFTIATRSRTVEAVVDSEDRLIELSVALIRSVLPPARGIRLLGVTVSGFDDVAEERQLELL